MPLDKTLTYQVMERIRRLIVEGSYVPGDRLGEQDLEARVGASRASVREALRLLEVQGLVVHIPRRGFRVRKMTRSEVRDLYELRADLEAKAVLALETRGNLEGLITELERHNTVMREAMVNDDVDAHLEGNIAFHTAILDHAANLPLKRAILQMNMICQPLRFSSLKGRARQNGTLDYHVQLLAELRRGDIPGAAETMREHILVSIPTVLRYYDEHIGESPFSGNV
ncbi:GntR family transcriptional regulator [bacterium]|nr:GntR family transcriptional regulator [bacterium]